MRHLQTVRFAVINRFQVVQTLWPVVGEKQLIRGIRLYYSQEGKRILERHKAARAFESKFAQETGRLRRLSRWLPAGISEHANQAIAFLMMHDWGMRHGWLVFPWERGETPAEDAVVRLLQAIGEDPDRDGLRDTPRRVVKALGEMTCGYLEDPADILATVFDVDFDEMIVVRRIPFVSLCEHHLLTFVGHATVGYVPKDLVVGLSKLARLVDCYARRLQVQERMTRQIADAIDTHLRPAGVAVLIESTHSCMSSRGVAKVAPMVTSDVRGCFRDQPEARAEFMALARGAT